MNRVIKFRAWSGERLFSDITGFECTLGRADGIFIDGDYLNIERDEVAVMQFTGLIDRNGREIYEGDIIESDKNCIFDQGRKACLVEYANGCFVTSDTKVPVSLIVESFKPVVIGNIYENPELLEVSA